MHQYNFIQHSELYMFASFFFFFFLQVMQNIGDGGRPQKNLCPVFTFKIVTVSINRTSIHSIKHQEIKISHKFRPDIKQCAHIITQLCKE